MTDLRVTGTCKRFGAGYGFVARDDGGPDCFAHWSAIRPSGPHSYRGLYQGQKCSFLVKQSPRGPVAFDIQSLDSE